jgi:hypothetical protein
MKFWIGVVSKNHVEKGMSLGIAQVGHGKRPPLARMREGDWLIYYSPYDSYLAKDKEVLQAFTGIGQITDEDIWEADEGDFKPWRRKIEYRHDAHDAPIRPLLDQLHLTQGKTNWGYQFRFGLLPIDEHDFRLIAEAMGVSL